MPKVLLDFLGLCFFFWSNEFSGSGMTEPIHIHVARGKPTRDATKIWITRDGVDLCHNNSKLSKSELSNALAYVSANRNLVIAAWYKYFGF